ncbi:hypothetical protein C8034_v007337 [Colletotrichum sidae]|uniref:Uncharacterized protein n=1 Tax=Colletotrichum sidae TaxID=1347389 RepID=A0A4V3I454_9PEZI|nr:hypothetical protein C8034_v007337 [Colletotrichum sidae]
MSSRNSMTVWLPKELYSSVEPLADQRFIWCPMPFDDSLPVEQTSFIHMEDEPARVPCSLRSPAAGDSSGSETEPEQDLPRRIGQNIGRGRRRPRKLHPLGDGRPGGNRGSRSFAVRLDLNLDIEVTLKARVHGDLELSACL